MRWISLSVLLASIAMAVVPYTFQSGVPAKAAQVNHNFEAMDSALTVQAERLAELRDQWMQQTDSLRRALASLGKKNRQDSLDWITRLHQELALDTIWKAALLPKGSVLGLLANPGADGFLPGSDKCWQWIDSFGVVLGAPTTVPAGQASKIDTATKKAATDSVRILPAAPTTIKPVLRWYVKVK